MVARYTHDIASWMDGTESLSDGEYRAYHVICELIYLQEGPIVPNEAGIAGRCNQSILAFRANLRHLITKGKLALADGKLTNKRASEFISGIKSRRDKISQALRKRISTRPPLDLTPTSPQPPPDDARKPLKSRRATLTAANGDSLSSSLLPFLEDSLTQGVSEVEIPSLAKWNFDEFWRQYPHKVGKRDAVKAFEAARKRGGSFVDVMAGLLRYSAKQDDRHWCNPSTFLNQDRWLDEPAANGGKHRDETIDEQTARLVEQAQRLEAERRAERASGTF